MTGTPIAKHLEPAELVRLLDGEVDDVERVRWERHLADCDHCAQEAGLMRSRGELIRRMLDRAAFEAPSPETTPLASARPRRARPGGVPAWAKAAAAVVLVAAPVAAFPTVRGWVTDRMPAASPPAPSAVRGAVDAGPTEIRFVPDPGEFTVEIEARQRSGFIDFRRAPAGDAILEVGGAEPAPRPVVSARLLRIENAGVQDASYALGLPAGVTGVTIRIGGVAAARLDAAAIDRGTEVRLDVR